MWGSRWGYGVEGWGLVVLVSIRLVGTAGMLMICGVDWLE